MTSSLFQIFRWENIADYTLTITVAWEMLLHSSIYGTEENAEGNMNNQKMVLKEKLLMDFLLREKLNRANISL